MMATSQQYSLRWNNYLRHITYAFDNLRTNDDFVDVTLCCDGKKIKAHKVLLSACSGYFKEIFKENPHPHPVIIFKFIKFEDLTSIIEFMYQGEVNVQQEALQSFLQTAELLAVQGLTSEEKEKPKNLKTQIEEQNVKTVPSTIVRTMAESNTQTQSVQLHTANVATSQSSSSSSSQPLLTTNTKKRKITFTDDDDVYTTETVEFATKEEASASIVKGTEMQFIPTPIKMDIPEYIDVSEGTQITDSGTQQVQTSDQDNNQTVTQFTSEYEILTESEIDEKFQHVEGENEITTIEMERILTTQASSESIKGDKGINSSQDLPNTKWTECQFCKMVITSVNLWRHIRTQHTPQPPRKCDYCQKNFKNKYSLREHIRISHEQHKHPILKGEN